MAFVQSTGAFASTSATNIAKAYTSNVTAGNVLIMCGSVAIPAASTFSVTDSQLNTWQAASPQAASASWKTQVFYAVAGASGANTVTFARTGAASTDERTIIIAEFSAVGALDGTGASGNNTTANPSINLTVSAGASLAVASVATTGTATSGAGFTDLVGQDGNDAEYQLNPASGTLAAVFTAAASTWCESAASFLAPVAAATVATGLRRFPLGV